MHYYYLASSLIYLKPVKTQLLLYGLTLDLMLLKLYYRIKASFCGCDIKAIPFGC